MSAFSTWAFRLKNHLASAGVTISLGQAQELLASGLGHNTRASLLASEAGVLQRADHVIFLAEAACKRAETLGIDLSSIRSISEVFDILDDPDGELAPQGVYYLRQPRLTGPVSEESFRDRVFATVEGCDHVLQHEIANELGGVRAKTVAELIECAVPLSDAGHEWTWTFTGWTRLVNKTEGWHVPVHGTVVFARLGRTLLGSGSIVRLARTGESQQFDDDMDQGDVYGYDGSD